MAKIVLYLSPRAELPAIYVDGTRHWRSGDRTQAMLKALELAGVEVRESDDHLGADGESMAQNVQEIEDFAMSRTLATLRAERMRADAADLLRQADELQSRYQW
jgi:5-enolpyruvylshikimate-3-phosphate synthase